MATFSDVIVRPDSADIPDLQTFIKFCLSSTEQSKGAPTQSHRSRHPWWRPTSSR